MPKKNIQPKLYARNVVQPDGKVIEVVTTQENAKDFILPMNLQEHPAWSKTRFGKLNESERSARTKNTGMDVFGS